MHSVAYRILGSAPDAEDAVQEAWLRASRHTGDEIENPPAWLTTIVACVSLSMLRARAARPETLTPPDEPIEPIAPVVPLRTPEEEAVLAESVGLAMLVVLETLSPDERLAFVLHDMFDLPFDQIAQVLGKSSDTSRQLASRARRKVRGQDLDAPDVEGDRRVVQAYLDAIKAGDLPTLVALLHPDVELTADAQAMSNGRPNHLVGVAKVSMGALYSADRAAVSEVALIDGRPGLVMAPGGQLAILLTFVIVEGQITRIDVVADPERLAAATIAV